MTTLVWPLFLFGVGLSLIDGPAVLTRVGLLVTGVAIGLLIARQRPLK